MFDEIRTDNADVRLLGQEEGEDRKMSLKQWIAHFKHTYGAGIITLLVFAYFNMGFRIMFALTVKDLFKLYLNLEPVESQTLSSLILLPSALKIFYGLGVDNLKIFGNSRNTYLKICGCLMVFSLVMAQMPFMRNKLAIVSMLFLYGVATSTADVVWDAIMVVSSRKDPIHGSSDLQTLHVVSIWVGGMFGAIAASITTQFLHPFYMFSFYALMGAIYTIFAFWIDDIRTDHTISVSENIRKSFDHLSQSIVYKSLIFLFFSKAIIPSYGDILYYWMIEVLLFSKTVIALLALVAFIMAIFGSFLYNVLLKDLEFRKIMIIAHVVIAISILGIFLLVTRISRDVFGINDYVFAIFGDAIIETLFIAFIYMPTLVFQTKIVPKNTEATVYSFFTSLSIFASQFVAPLWGSFIASQYELSKNNFDSIGTVVLIEFFLSLVPLTIVWILPTNSQIVKYKEKLDM